MVPGFLTLQTPDYTWVSAGLLCHHQETRPVIVPQLSCLDLLEFIMIFDLWCAVMWCECDAILLLLSPSLVRWWIKMWGTQSSLVSAEQETFLVSSWELFSMVCILGTNTAMFSASLSHGSLVAGNRPGLQRASVNLIKHLYLSLSLLPSQ